MVSTIKLQDSEEFRELNTKINKLENISIDPIKLKEITEDSITSSTTLEIPIIYNNGIAKMNSTLIPAIQDMNIIVSNLKTSIDNAMPYLPGIVQQTTLGMPMSNLTIAEGPNENIIKNITAAQYKATWGNSILLEFENDSNKVSVECISATPEEYMMAPPYHKYRLSIVSEIIGSAATGYMVAKLVAPAGPYNSEQENLIGYHITKATVVEYKQIPRQYIKPPKFQSTYNLLSETDGVFVSNSYVTINLCGKDVQIQMQEFLEFIKLYLSKTEPVS